METLFIIVAFWLIVIGIWGALPMLRTPRLTKFAGPKFVSTPLTAHIEREAVIRPTTGEAVPVRVARVRTNPLAMFGNDTGVDQYAEVSMLRAQIEHLRSEIATLSTAPERDEHEQRFREELEERELHREREERVVRNERDFDDDEDEDASEPREARRQTVTYADQHHTSEERTAARQRRFKAGLYTDLPRPLRRQVREVRNERRPLRAS